MALVTQVSRFVSKKRSIYSFQTKPTISLTILTTSPPCLHADLHFTTSRWAFRATKEKYKHNCRTQRSSSRPDAPTTSNREIQAFKLRGFTWPSHKFGKLLVAFSFRCLPIQSTLLTEQYKCCRSYRSISLCLFVDIHQRTCTRSCRAYSCTARSENIFLAQLSIRPRLENA